MKKFKILLIILGSVLLMNGNVYSMCSCEPGAWLSFGLFPTSIVELSNGCDCKGCGAPCYRLVEELNLNSGIYEIVGQYPWNLGYSLAYDLSHNRVFTNETVNLTTFHAISVPDMKVAGTFTLDVSPGTDMDSFQPTLKVSPDGSRIYVNGEVFDGHTYKLINQDTAFSDYFTFSPDSKRIYYTTYIINTSVNPAEIIPKINIFDASTGNLISTINYKKIVSAYPQFPINLSSKRPNWDYPHIGNVENGEFVPVFIGKPPNHIGYVYNIKTGAVSPTVTITVGKGYGTDLSDNGKWWITDLSHKEITIYSVSTGNKVAGFDISSSTGKGAIISWPDDHTFIYNTTQKLIYFDIIQNKVIKQLPIIRPWEKPGWKPEVGK